MKATGLISDESTEQQYMKYITVHIIIKFKIFDENCAKFISISTNLDVPQQDGCYSGLSCYLIPLYLDDWRNI